MKITTILPLFISSQLHLFSSVMAAPANQQIPDLRVIADDPITCQGSTQRGQLSLKQSHCIKAIRLLHSDHPNWGPDPGVFYSSPKRGDYQLPWVTRYASCELQLLMPPNRVSRGSWTDIELSAYQMAQICTSEGPFQGGGTVRTGVGNLIQITIKGFDPRVSVATQKLAIGGSNATSFVDAAA